MGTLNESSLFGKNSKSSGSVDRAKKIYRTILIFAAVAGAIYILSNIVVVYEAMASRITIPITSTQQTGIFIGIARYIILALAFIWLFAESKKDNTPSTTADIKRYFFGPPFIVS